jgi:hypothetical protein
VEPRGRIAEDRLQLTRFRPGRGELAEHRLVHHQPRPPGETRRIVGADTLNGRIRAQARRGCARVRERGAIVADGVLDARELDADPELRPDVAEALGGQQRSPGDLEPLGVPAEGGQGRGPPV